LEGIEAFCFHDDFFCDQTVHYTRGEGAFARPAVTNLSFPAATIAAHCATDKMLTAGMGHGFHRGRFPVDMEKQQ
jgi:hypothetical protein